MISIINSTFKEFRNGAGLNNCTTAYKLDKKSDVNFQPNIDVFSDIQVKDFELVKRPATEKNIAKLLLKERISGKSLADCGEAAPYLEYNAQTRGDDDLLYAVNVVSQCQKSVVWFEGEQSGSNYLKTIDCRKQWCPVCGGKGGKIHKSRLSSILTRVDIDKYNIRQFVFTIPEHLRELLKDRNNLNLLFSYCKQTTEKFFGSPVFDKKGHVKKYKLEKGVISYLHLFGDVETGVFKPHINVHIFEDKNIKLKLSESVLNSIKQYWLKKLKNFDESLTAVDVHYKFRIIAGQKMHAIKYMSRPWSHEDFEAVQDDNLKSLMVLGLSGFQYLRFWGALANCCYKDEMNLKDIKTEFESKVNEKLIMRFVSPFNYDGWKLRLIEIEGGFYKVIDKVKKNEREKSQKNEAV